MDKKRIVILSALAIFFFCSLIPCHVLRIEAIRKKRPVFAQLVRPNDQFSTKYIHSVELSPVQEFFKIDKNFRIVLYETIFASSNTGLPTTLSGDETLYINGDHLRITNMCRVVPHLDLWVNEQYDNTLTLGDGRIVKLPSLAGDTILRVTVTRMTFLEFLYVKAKILT